MPDEKQTEAAGPLSPADGTTAPAAGDSPPRISSGTKRAREEDSAAISLAPSASNDASVDGGGSGGGHGQGQGSSGSGCGTTAASASGSGGGTAVDSSERPDGLPPDGGGSGGGGSGVDGKGSIDPPPTDPTPQAPAAAVISDDDPGTDHSIPTDEDGNPTVVWKPQSQQSTCEFTHVITDYAKKRESGCKKAEYSETTVDDQGNLWRLIVYVNGNGRASNHHLSLFLQVADADDLPFGWKKAVSYVLTLEHPSGPNMGYAKRNPDKTFKLCPKAIDWGWSQFITSDRIQQEGYVQNDTLTVRASVTVKTSSVSIDPEDAELYLKCAVEEGSPSAVEACLAQGAGVNCQFKDDLYTPLHTACSSSTNEGSVDVLKLLLKRGADPNAVNKWRETPLLIAANNGHTKAVVGLLQNNADPSLVSEAGWSALTFAADKGYDDIVTLLLDAEAPINVRVTEDLSTPLHKACAGSKEGHLEAVKLLLEGGADVHALNKWRETPLLTAANHGQAKAVEALLRHNADPCKCTDTGWSPLSIAAYKGHDEVVKLLLEEGAPTEEDDRTLSALLQAATKGLPDTVDLLLRHGADHTVTTKKGDAALSILVEQDLIDAAVSMVTEFNASIARCSKDRKKVQRARLLINLEIKNRKREGHPTRVDQDDDSEPDMSGEEDEDDTSAQHDSDGSARAGAPSTGKKTGKKKKKNSEKRAKLLAAAEAVAKAAEEALLMELEKEETTAQMDEAKNESKRNKKKKKKERERQKKLLEEKARQEKEELEAAEREKERKRKLDEERKAREEKERAEMEQKKREHEEKQRIDRANKEKARKETAEREAKEAAERKEKDEREKRQREQEKKDRERRERLERKATEANASQLAPETGQKERQVQPKGKNAKKQQANAKIAHTKAVVAPAPAPAAAVVRNRGWEVKTPVNTPSTAVKAPAGVNIAASPAPPPPLTSPSTQRAQTKPQTQPQLQFSPMPSPSVGPSARPDSGGRGPQVPAFEDNVSASFSVEEQLEEMPSGVLDFLGFDGEAPSNGVGDQASSEPLPVPQQAQQKMVPSLADVLSKSIRQAGPVDLPAVSIFQQEKLAALLQRCAAIRSAPPSTGVQDPIALVDERTLKAVIYRWIVRASHEAAQRSDPIIPSWTDAGLLSQYLQRQFISESRRGMGGSSGAGMVNMEVLREAGVSLAQLCQGFAKEVAEFRSKCAQQLPGDWSDGTINISANEVMSNDGQSTIVVIDWAGRSQVYVPSPVFAKLRDRYCGPPGQLLTAIFSAGKQYETFGLIVSGSRLDYRLPSAALDTMGHEASVSVELWTSPLAVHGSNVFCGIFPEVDSLFGGLSPFGKEGGGGEEALIQYGGSAVVMPPLESTTASRYMRTIIDALERADATKVPLSFVMVIPVECFPTAISTPSANDLCILDPRLSDLQGALVRRVEVLPAGQHAFASGSAGGASEVSQSGSILALMQNDAGVASFSVNDASVGTILRSMTLGYVAMARDNTSPMPSASAIPNGTMNTASFDGFGQDGSLGGEVIGGGIGGRRGRLFDLVDNDVVEAEASNDVDVMSGMLNNLDVNIFQGQTSQDVDIEAISLMGFGSSALGGSNPNNALGGGGSNTRGF